jgi:hypothetical protein
MMSNVKAGDLAKIASQIGTGGLHGARVFVQEEAFPKNFEEALQLFHMGHVKGPIWRVQMLETRVKVNGSLVPAGTYMFADDSILRRIDPPEDGEDIYSEAPLQGEKEPVHG